MPLHVFIKLFFLYFFLLCCTSCGHKNKSEGASQTLTVSAEPIVNTLFYNGNIKPIRTIAVNNAQADGFISKKKFEYGDQVTKNQLLFVIVSQQLSKDFQSALSEYVKAKKNFADVKFQMDGAEQLKKLNILSQQEYVNTKTQMFNAELDFDQAERKLHGILQDLGMPTSMLENLDSTNPTAINTVLSHAPNSIKKYSPANGIALMPEDTSNSKDNPQTALMEGSQIKPGQNLVVIGDMSGISVNIKVTEVNVGALKPGQRANITSDAFPDVTLEGVVSHVDRQAIPDSSGGIPSFSVTIVIPKISLQQLATIRVGMSAKVSISIATTPKIKIPLNAVITKNGKTYVDKVDPNTKKIQEWPIKTGATELNSVEILEGLKNGDEVRILNASTH